MTLDALALKHGTDKSSAHHNYAVIYEQYFKHLQHEPILFVTAGIGGYENTNIGGHCLRMWREWFTKARIIGIDLYKKSFAIPGVEIMQCSQDNEYMSEICRGANIFIDDASHRNPLTLKTFDLVWPVLAPSAFYVIEDVESSWCTADGWAQGCSDPYDYNAKTAFNLAVHLANGIQYSHKELESRKDVESVHFHKNVVIIKKK